ncbi:MULTISPECIES: TRAP transporter large permease subunit [Bradyrhizobium]|uniref:Membrane protein n=3 Tax=Bradyrhizobium TaxID=374 RepID=A0A410VIV9_9BRAD|nr:MULTISPECIES: TRAP transporter large permease subunit [Bradyrhizobium]MCG2629472.1 TRAP transporter large permease subunit [Bradyrhizobium zhengyangense]MCG2644900.1 TRAP transporter large permease subunit [Bradyrhizobium zhengyangense]MCG2670986.1 TRAP transporter large permease subunit [Bradyrhizobium zhengyangense]MDN4984621.1 TRAP transporter large permease subunit [Bradyrhizobium sp. WYCCWR 13022]MDN5002613.1 TRAP transporter large permease subunit [Bradyrhizobium sp. WYCCWR 12677]
MTEQVCDVPASGHSHALSRFGLGAIAEIMVAIALALQLAITLLSVLIREVTPFSILSVDETAKLSLSVIAFMGGAIAYRRAEHASIEVITKRLTPHWRQVLGCVVDLGVLVTAISILRGSASLFMVRLDEHLPITGWPTATLVVPLGLGLLLIALTAAERLLAKRGRPLLVALAAATVLAGCLFADASLFTQTFSSRYSLVALLIVLFAMIGIGMPIGFALMAGSLIYLLANDIPLVAIAQSMIDANSNFILLALPFFILAGGIMDQGGISVRFVRFAMSLVGHFRGGLLQVVVITTYLVSGISGSKAADVVAVGSVMRRELERTGYKPQESAAALAASAAMSETIPPSIAMLILGTVTPVSIGTLFVAGLIPAAVIAVMLMLLIYVSARNSGLSANPKATAGERARAGTDALLPLGMPVIMILGIKFGFATPTEVSSIAVLYGLVLASVFYRALTLRACARILIEAGRLTGMVLFIVAAAGAFGWVLTAAGLNAHLSQVVALLGNSKLLFLLGSIALIIIVGALLEGLPAIIILAPVLMPIANQLGIDSIHYAMVIILSIGVGVFMPPVGIGFYIACAVVRADIDQASRSMVPYLVVLCLGVLLIAYVPWFTHALPNLIGK